MGVGVEVDGLVRCVVARHIALPAIDALLLVHDGDHLQGSGGRRGRGLGGGRQTGSMVAAEMGGGLPCGPMVAKLGWDRGVGGPSLLDSGGGGGTNGENGLYGL